jgi:hypothetical protein
MAASAYGPPPPPAALRPAAALVLPEKRGRRICAEYQCGYKVSGRQSEPQVRRHGGPGGRAAVQQELRGQRDEPQGPAAGVRRSLP